MDDRVAAGGLSPLADHEEPTWQKPHYPAIDYQAVSYYSAPKQKERRSRWTRSTRRSARPTTSWASRSASRRSWPASRSTTCSTASRSATTFRAKLAELGVIFCSISEAIREHPELVRKYLGSVVPQGDNFFAALNSAVFSDGSFVYVPKGVRCPMELSTYFRINAANTGQFERTLIIADEGAYVSYLEGCTAPMRDENQLHAAVVELVTLDEAEIKYSTVQNWYPGDKDGKGGIYNFVTKRGACRGRKSKISWTQVETGSAITWKYPSCVLQGDEFGGRVLLGGRHQQPPAGRHRHQDDPHRQEHPLADRRQGHRRRPLGQHLSRPGAHAEVGRGRAQPHPVRQPADRRHVRRPHGALHRGQEPHAPSASTRPPPARSATTSCSTAAAAASPPRTRWPSSSAASAAR